VNSQKQSHFYQQRRGFLREEVALAASENLIVKVQKQTHCEHREQWY